MQDILELLQNLTPQKGENSQISEKRHIHFIGIGGSGMYPLAQILHKEGFYLTGSDNNETSTLQKVREMGITVFLGQRPENIQGAKLIVHTAAIMADNPELIAAKSSGVPVLERSELLGIVTSWYNKAIGIAGTHGKTTTTSMIVHILESMGEDFSAFIGGKLPIINGSAKVGTSDIFVCEACEFNDTFLKLSPNMSVILNIDNDHLDYFGTIENSIQHFREYAEKNPDTIFVNGDDENTLKAVNGLKNIKTFGLNEQNDIFAKDIRIENGKFVFTICVKSTNTEITNILLNVPGKHNIYNALAAFSVINNLFKGEKDNDFAQNIETFTGAGRRFEKTGKINGAVIFDDYAHHPTEVAATLSAAKNMQFKRVIAVFQPFTFSRTALLLDDFADALKIADIAVITDIMGSREKNTYNIFAEDLAEKIPNSVYFSQNKEIEYTPERKEQNFADVVNYLKQTAQNGDLIITLGCGDVYKIAEKLKELP